MFAILLLLAAPFAAQAEDCSAYPNGVLDGFAGTVAPSQLQIDQNCTVRNYPASNPLSTNFSFLTQPGQTNERWLIVFDNVMHIGQMACNAVAGHKIWFTNGSSTQIQEDCQNLLIPVEKINKENPAGPGTIPVGVPFTYRLTLPVLFDPATSTVINTAGSVNDLHGISVRDDLNAAGADLSYVSHTAYWLDSGAPVPHSFSNVGGLLTFDNFPIIPAGRQVIVEVTVILDNSPANTIGTQFVNTAKWDFGRLIDGVFYEPLPGEWGTTPPLTIAAPDLTLTKTGPATLNLGESGDFTLDVQNIGNMDAWNATIVDRLPDGPTGGMCDNVPLVLSAQVFAADGVTPVPGKGPLVQGSDFSASYSGAPDCRLDLVMLSAAALIGPNERLIVTYQSEIDANTDNNVTLTNVAAATQWFSADPSDVNRLTYLRSLTNGTVGALDHEDAHTITVALTGYFFEKFVENLTSGASPAATAAPGDRLRYTLRLRTTDTPLTNVSFYDDLGAMNTLPVFVPGSLQLVAGTIPPGANAVNIDSVGGINGTGVIDVRDLDVAADSEVQVQFDVTLASVLGNGLLVVNQAGLFDIAKLADSDDPNINGRANPDITGDEDPTQVRIVSSPDFRVEKTSSYLTGDPSVLLAGETLRYTITVQNTGTENATNVTLIDQIPTNTIYLSGSTTLNGVVITDNGAGNSRLTEGLPINAPGGVTPGSMNAAVPNNVATISFDVVVDPDVADGVVLSNQAFLSAPGQGIVNQPSDDPRTEIADDPTMDIVGRLPLLFATKSVVLQVDSASPGIVDPGDVLRYTITAYNSGTVPATVVSLLDVVPANTTYVADTLTLNGAPVGQPDGGIFPLAAGIPISSGDLTLPLPGAGEGVLSPGESAVVQFDLLVDAGVPTGTLITNQATVYSDERPNLLTDGDGNLTTGPEPTVVVVGDAQQLSIVKAVAVVGGGLALAGATLEYTVTVRNIGDVPALYVVITDDLALPSPGYLAYVDGSATMNAWPDGITVTGSLLTADYSSVNGPLAPGESVVLRFRAVIAPDLAIGTRVTNLARVSWNNPLQWAEASVAIDVGAAPGTGILSGSIWHDADFDDTLDTAERALVGWTVTLLIDDQAVRNATTDAAGAFVMAAIQPNYLTGEQYSLRFDAPGASARTASLGRTDSEFTDGLQRIEDIIVDPGSVLTDLNLPIDPNGVIYDSITRRPLSGVTLTLIDAAGGMPIPGRCFDDLAQQDQVTLGTGYYKFDINFADPACPSGANYIIVVTPPGGSFVAGVSELIPPTSDLTTSPFNVPLCPASANDAVVVTNQHCEVQYSELAPPTSIPAGAAGTVYHTHLTLDDSRPPGSSQLFNNHIPIDQDLSGAVAVTKTTPMFNVTRGQMVPYVITIDSSFGIDLAGIGVVDRLPAGFRYVEGSARVDAAELEPMIVGRDLIWSNLSLESSGQRTIKLLLAVGAGVSEGEFTNRAQAISSATGTPLSAEATATVRLVPDPTFDCTDLTGKVFNDYNRDGYQDDGEEGLPGVRIVTGKGLAATTDSYGRYHVTCAIVPNENRGSNFVVKLDDRTLPTGFRGSTRPVQVQRATRGKALKINFGASIHRVIGIDIADAAFEPDSVELREQWKPRIELLLEELKKAPAVLRLSYVADIEEEPLVERRIDRFKTDIMDAWREQDCCYELVIEPEIFWRRGGPPERSEAGSK
jgi:uncharacterized repeat protein (TIGR01451 family)